MLYSSWGGCSLARVLASEGRVVVAKFRGFSCFEGFTCHSPGLDVRFIYLDAL